MIPILLLLLLLIYHSYINNFTRIERDGNTFGSQSMWPCFGKGGPLLVDQIWSQGPLLATKSGPLGLLLGGIVFLRDRTKRTKRYKEKIVHGIHKLPLNDQPSVQPRHCDKDSNSEVLVDTGPVLSLSVSRKDADLPEEIYEGMWIKASQLIAKGNSITDAPGLSCSKMVYSSTNPKKPHLVTYYKNGKVTCDCLNYTTKYICAHTLAVAEVSHLLPSFIEWYKGTGGANLWELAKSSGVPKHPGKKPTTRKRSRKVLPPVKTTSKPVTHVRTGNSTSPPSKRQETSSTKDAELEPRPHHDASQQGDNCASYLDSTSPSHSSPSSIAPMATPQYMYPDSYRYPSWPMGPGYIPPPWYYGMPYSSSFDTYGSPSSYQYAGTSQPYCSSGSSSNSLQTVYRPSSSPHPFTLKMLNSRITKCQGCKQQFRSAPSSTIYPPDNLIVSRLECRPFIAPDGAVKVTTTPKNSHYHLNMECLTKADASFKPQCLVLPDDLKGKLLNEHKSYLSDKFGITA